MKYNSNCIYSGTHLNLDFKIRIIKHVQNITIYFNYAGKIIS